MNNEEILRTIKPILKQISPSLDSNTITMQSLLINDIKIDSIKIAELSVLFEDTFNKTFFIPDLITKVEDPYSLTIGDLVEYIQKSLGS